jgi:myo-inositol-1(or 4)-monophosphatase
LTDWQELLTGATALVQKACASLASGKDRARALGRGASGDETLAADREAERLILEALLPVQGLRVLSEEAGEVGPKRSRYLAVVDPLDGSSNFARGIPFYCSSICIIGGTRLRGAEAAVVRNLTNGDVYYAERTAGASKNGRPLRPSQAEELSGAIAAFDLSGTESEGIERVGPLLSKLRRVVHFGANALEMCMVSDGAVDCFLDLRGRMRVTDVAGAYLIAKETGIPVTTEGGDEIDPPLDLKSGIRVVTAGNQKLQDRLLIELIGLRGRRL